MNILTSIATIFFAVIAIAILFAWAFRAEKKHGENFSKSLNTQLPVKIKTIKQNAGLSNIRNPPEVLKGGFGKAKLQPLVYATIESKDVYVFGYHAFAENIDLYANRSIVAINLSSITPTAVVTCGRRLNPKIVKDLWGHDVSPRELGGDRRIHLDSSTTGNSGGYVVSEKVIDNLFSENFFNKHRAVEWVEMGGQYIILIGPRKINTRCFQQLCSAAEDTIKSWPL